MVINEEHSLLHLWRSPKCNKTDGTLKVFNTGTCGPGNFQTLLLQFSSSLKKMRTSPTMVEYRLLHHVYVLFLTIDQVLKML